jgi:hypothetical protein
MFVNVKLAGDGVSVPAVTPVPDKATSTGELAPATVIAIVPVVGPRAGGEKVTVKFALWFAPSVMGRVGPLAAKSPVAPTELIVTFPLLAFVTVSVWLCLVPTGTLPKLKLVGLVVRLPGAMAEPVRVTLRGLVEPQLKLTLPITLPVAVGLKTT